MLRRRVQLNHHSTTTAESGPLSVPEKHGIDILRDPNLNKVSGEESTVPCTGFDEQLIVAIYQGI